MGEMVKVDIMLTSTLKGGSYGMWVKLKVALIVMSSALSFE